MATTVFYASTTGKTEDIADRIAVLLGDGATVKDVEGIASTEELARADALICCVPTWNTGADTLRSGTAWDSHVETIPDLDLANHVVAIVGLGDSSTYADYFCDAMEELYMAFKQAGARLIGTVPTTGYTFDQSRSVINGQFCGLPIDEDSEPDLTDQRLEAWVAMIKAELL